MPKRNITLVQMPPEKPDCCACCPMCGIIPKHMRKKGSYETYVCLGTMNAMTQRFIRVKASNRDSHHPLKRPCDDRWDCWMQAPNRKIGVNSIAFLEMRIPYENGLAMQIKFSK